MKNTICFIALITVFTLFSCSKDKPSVTNSGMVTLRYDFSADTVGNFNFTYTADTLINYETTNSQSWTKTITVTKADMSKTDSATVTVFPPADWTGTTIESNATVKIYVNGTEKASKSALLGGYDRPTGLKVTATY